MPSQKVAASSPGRKRKHGSGGSGRGTNTSPTRAESPKRKRRNSKDSPIKTRAVQKKSTRESGTLSARCVLCLRIDEAGSSSGKLVRCKQCRAAYHAAECLRYTPAMCATVQQQSTHGKWTCPRCARCATCHLFICDPCNVECAGCASVFCGRCVPQHPFGTAYRCQACCKSKGEASKRHETTAQRKTTLPPMLFDYVEPETPVKAGEAESTPGNTEVTKKKTAKKIPTTSSQRAPPPLDLRREKLANERKALDTRLEREAGEFIERCRFSRQATSGRGSRNSHRNESGSPKRPGSSTPSPSRKPILDNDGRPKNSALLATSTDYELYLEARRDLEEARARLPTKFFDGEPSSVQDQWVVLGNCVRLKALYKSPYPSDIASASTLHVCYFCLRAFSSAAMYHLHEAHCQLRHPPGNEIYRDENISFFEVDGFVEQMYARHLCLLAKLFLSSKTLHDEVHTFFFYVLTENCDAGARIVGYFSKEKNPSKNNNLSCLLTLPSSQKSGYGKLLIDMSYALSRVERRVGGPEHPVSDLGLAAYRAYWRAAIQAYLRSLRDGNAHSVNIKSVSLATRIHPTDVVNQLLADGMLLYKDGVYYIKAERGVFKCALSEIRRRVVRANRLRWRPSTDPSFLDEDRLNPYA